MTECIDGVCYMTPQFQWSTALVALFCVLLIGLGITVVVKGIISENKMAQLKEDVLAESVILYLRHSKLESVPLVSDRFAGPEPEQPEDTSTAQLISPEGLRWLVSKIIRK